MRLKEVFCQRNAAAIILFAVLALIAGGRTEAQSMVFVGGRDASSLPIVSVINGATGQTIAQLHMSNGFTNNGVGSLAVNPAGTRLYVTLDGVAVGTGGPPLSYRLLSVFDIATFTEIAQLYRIGDTTRSLLVSPDGARVYWVSKFSFIIDVVDTTTNNIVNQMTGLSGLPAGMTILADGRLVFLLDAIGSPVTPANPHLDSYGAGGAFLATAAIPGTTGVLAGASPDGQHLYVTGDGDLIDVETGSFSVLGTVPVTGTIAFARDRMYASGDTSIAVIDIATRAVMGSIPVASVPAARRLVARPDGAGLFLSDGDSLKTIAAATNIVTTVTTLPAAFSHELAAVAALTFDHNPVRFAALKSGATLAAQTPAQTVTIGVPNGLAWTAASDQPFVTVTPTSGTGSGTITVQVLADPSLPSSGLVSAKVAVTAPGLGNSPQAIDVSLRLIAPASTVPPFGSFDTPINGTTGVTGAIPVTGWALDDIAVSKVQLCRNAVAGDPAPGCPGAPDKIYIGDTTFVAGTRPDVESIYSDFPMAYRGSWGYRLLTNLLPDLVAGTPAGGRGTFTLYAYALDVEGHATPLGPRTFTCDNTTATKPFGTIDTPVPGETVSGMFHNFGWVLTPPPGMMPTDGSTITLYIDGVARGTAQYNFPRSDIQALFPGYANTDGAIGYFAIDTTTLTNGLHVLYWIATDSLGRSDGIGSRYFTVLN